MLARLLRSPLLASLLVASACAPGAGDDAEIARDGARASSPEAALEGQVRTSTRGLDGTLLAQAYRRAAELPRLHSLLVARHGDLAREEYFGGPGRDRAVNVKSVSKSVLSALVGIAIAEGHLEGLDQPVAPLFPEHVRTDVDPRIDEVTLAHLLSMQAGLEPTSFGNYGRWVSSSNWVRFALRRPFVDEPGGRMLYSTGNSHVLSAALTRATGTSTLDYAREKLGRPLGIQVPAWTRDPQGVYFGGNQMSLRPRDLLAFGELYRNGGRHEGEQVVPEEWIRESWRRRATSPFNGHGYGLGWWMRPSGAYDVYFAWGYGGQYLFIVPDLELTVVTTSDPVSPRQGDHNRAVQRLLDESLIPAAETGAG
ncbi:MAG TPA: serine hydrolase [Thermoanaerobaculia bacterium]|nr:serine hydrolase [Thermoanaerobaculia bacterium]